MLRDGLDLCDKYYKIFPGWHVEQFSLSIVLQGTMRLFGCQKQVLHYWHNKPIFEKATKRFFSLIAEGHYEEALSEAGKIIPQMILQMRAKYFLSQSKVWLRDLPGVYTVYKFFANFIMHLSWRKN